MSEENNTLEIVIQDEALLKEVTFNYDQLKTGLSERLKKYNELVVTEDAIKSAKQDRANLNKLSKALSGKGVEIKKKLLGGFDIKLKELVGLVDNASDSIDAQVNKFEQIVKDQKKAEIKSIYDSNIGDLVKLVPFEKIFNDKMLNVTSTIPKITDEIVNRIDTIRKDLAVIDTLNVDNEIKIPVKDYYLQNFDLSGALSEKARLEKRKEDLIALQNKPKEQEVVIKQVQPSIEVVPAINVEPILEQIDFRVWVTQEQKIAIKNFLINSKIKYGKVSE